LNITKPSDLETLHTIVTLLWPLLRIALGLLVFLLVVTGHGFLGLVTFLALSGLFWFVAYGDPSGKHR
jgi:hypothetical protein